jgi:pyruvate dehydrogenase E2 component (dihydrolipoamide acetyltransferase)
VGKAVAMGLAKTPSLNGRIALGRFEGFDTVDVAFLVALDDGKDLAKVKIERLDEKDVTEVAKQLRAKAKKLRDGKDEEFEKSKGPLKALPTWLIRPMVHSVGFLTSGMGVDLKALGLEAFPFGSCIVTSVGMFGLDEGFAPPTPWARVPVYVLVGAISKRPTVIDGELVVRDLVTITATIDHRFVDGAQAGAFARLARKYLEDPWLLLPEDQRPKKKAAGKAKKATKTKRKTLH